MATYTFKMGFKVKADQLGSLAGTPLENERYFFDASGMEKGEQYTTTGRMEWVKKINKVYFYSDTLPNS